MVLMVNVSSQVNGLVHAVRSAEGVIARSGPIAGFHGSSSLDQGAATGKLLAVPQAPTPYNLFVKDNIAKVKKEHPNMKNVDIFKQLGQKWASVGSQKQQYVSKAQSLKKEHDNKVSASDALRKKLDYFLHRPANAYVLFAKEKKTTVMEPGKDKLRKLAEQWKKMSADQKKKFVSEAKTDQDNFASRMAKLSQDDAAALKELVVERKMNKLKRLGHRQRKHQLRQWATKYNRPKRPVVGIAAYLKQQWNSLPKGGFIQKAKAAMDKWNGLTKFEKQKLLDKDRLALVQYKKDMAAWEQKMTKDGHKDVVEKFHSRKWKSFLPAGVKIPGQARAKKPSKAALLLKRSKKAALRQKKREALHLKKQKKMQLLKKKKGEIKKQKAQLKAQLAQKKKATALKKKAEALKKKASALAKKALKKVKASKVAKKTRVMKKAASKPKIAKGKKVVIKAKKGGKKSKKVARKH